MEESILTSKISTIQPITYMKRKLHLVIFLLLSCNLLPAQDILPPFYQDIQKFKQQDSLSFPPRKAILFIGSSSFTNWKDVQDYFSTHSIVNRAFGGSSLPDVVRYVNDIVFPYQPKQIIIYCGENDLAGNDSVSAEIVFNRFKQFFLFIRSRLPNVSIGYVSMKASPSRERLWPKMREGNLLIKNYLKTKKQTVFIDVYYKMFNKNGKVMQEIFIKDNLHMNAKGYAIWQKIIEPYLLD